MSWPTVSTIYEQQGQQTNKNSHTTCQGILLRTKRARAEGVPAAWRGRAVDVLPTLPLPLASQGEGKGARASERGREATDPLPALLLPRAGRGGTRRERGEHIRLPGRGREAGRERARGLRSSTHSALCFFRGRGGTRRAWDEARAQGHEAGRRGRAAGDLLPPSASSASEAGRGEGGARRGRPGCVGARGRRERARGRWSSPPVCFFRGWGGMRRGGAQGGRERVHRRRSSAPGGAGRGEARAGRLSPALLFGGEGGANWRGSLN
ncbi:hypothetical protein Taro_000209 [Colocasia esculenta]|uniref:Uncharacterized protein n=1 Tax=Colocasia esculenta TaxID=4460 RepID=A0A843TA51_COLES|nr:hypothetical protein [Colocasia esculenta]